MLYAVQSQFIYGALKAFCYIMLKLEPNIPSSIPIQATAPTLLWIFQITMTLDILEIVTYIPTAVLYLHSIFQTRTIL